MDLSRFIKELKTIGSGFLGFHGKTSSKKVYSNSKCGFNDLPIELVSKIIDHVDIKNPKEWCKMREVDKRFHLVCEDKKIFKKMVKNLSMRKCFGCKRQLPQIKAIGFVVLFMIIHLISNSLINLVTITTPGDFVWMIFKFFFDVTIIVVISVLFIIVLTGVDVKN